MSQRRSSFVTIVVLLSVAPPIASAGSIEEMPVITGPLRLSDVLDSTNTHLPKLLAAREQVAIAEGRRLAAEGGFDMQAEALFLDDDPGFYEHEQIDVSLAQPLRVGGIELEAGYRRGNGNFADWDGGLQTNGDGEARLEARFPLLRGRAVDSARVELWRSRLEVERTDAQVSAAIQRTRLEAAQNYWRWLAAGERLRIADHLLELASDREVALSAAVEEGLLPEIDLLDNERLIAERQAIRIQRERGLEQAAIRLSFFLRDDEGEPKLPHAAQLPPSFPGLPLPLERPLEVDLRTALERRPELRVLDRRLDQIDLTRRKARNDLLPRFDFTVKGSQDYGEAASTPDDKADFELTVGLQVAVPLQRREAKGATMRANAESTVAEQRLRQQRDRIGIEVRDAISAARQARLRIEQARRSVTLAEQLEEAERFQLEEGNSDLLRLNIRERQTAEAASFLVGVLQEYFEAWTRYRYVLGLADDSTQLDPTRPAA